MGHPGTESPWCEVPTQGLLDICRCRCRWSKTQAWESCSSQERVTLEFATFHCPFRLFHHPSLPLNLDPSSRLKQAELYVGGVLAYLSRTPHADTPFHIQISLTYCIYSNPRKSTTGRACSSARRSWLGGWGVPHLDSPALFLFLPYYEPWIITPRIYFIYQLSFWKERWRSISACRLSLSERGEGSRVAPFLFSF